MKALDRSRIAAIEIIKGPSAIREYGDDAKRGVIVIRTKPAGGQ
jgi:outer membrane receptor for ferrienterochelin and colicin